MLTSQKMMKSIVMRGVYLIRFILMTAVMSTFWLTIYAPSLEAQHVQTVCTAVFLCYLICLFSSIAPIMPIRLGCIAQENRCV